jgi:hypothetical protein
VVQYTGGGTVYVAGKAKRKADGAKAHMCEGLLTKGPKKNGASNTEVIGGEQSRRGRVGECEKETYVGSMLLVGLVTGWSRKETFSWQSGITSAGWHRRQSQTVRSS